MAPDAVRTLLGHAPFVFIDCRARGASALSWLRPAKEYEYIGIEADAGSANGCCATRFLDCRSRSNSRSCINNNRSLVMSTDFSARADFSCSTAPLPAPTRGQLVWEQATYLRLPEHCRSAMLLRRLAALALLIGLPDLALEILASFVRADAHLSGAAREQILASGTLRVWRD